MKVGKDSQFLMGKREAAISSCLSLQPAALLSQEPRTFFEAVASAKYSNISVRREDVYAEVPEGIGQFLETRGSEGAGRLHGDEGPVHTVRLVPLDVGQVRDLRSVE